jgi:ABC-type nitrate/sulfonate/bicarbonate transport system permease component
MFLTLVGWTLLAGLVGDPLKLPGPLLVVESMGRVGPELARHAAMTWLRVCLGLLAGFVVGVAWGFLLRTSKAAAFLGTPILEMLRPVPAVALVPFFILWLGISLLSQVTLVAYAVTMTMAVGTFGALGNVNPEYIRAGLCLGSSTWGIVRRVLWPAILPELVSSVRIAAGLAFAVAIVSEFMGAQSGLGFLIMIARRVLRTETIVLAVVVLGLEAWFTDVSIRRLATARLKWFRVASSAVQ